MAWTITDGTPSRRVFTRPLSPYELGFFYDGEFNGVADIVENYLAVTRDESLFRPENVSRAWVAVKQIFPLLGATTKELGSQTPGALLVVSELDLGIARPNDATFGLAQSEEEVHSIADQLITGLRQLSDHLLARLYIYSRTDKPGHFHALFHCSHIIIDGISALTMIRTFFDILSLPPYAGVLDLQTRLALCVGTHNLNPNKHLPGGQRRWRQAAGQIIRQSRFQKLKVRLRWRTSSQLALTVVGRNITPAGGDNVHRVQHCSLSQGNSNLFAARDLPPRRKLQKTLHHYWLSSPRPQPDGIHAGASSKVPPW